MTLGVNPPVRHLRDYLFHIHTVQDLFLAVWRGAPLQAPPKEAPELTFLLASGAKHPRRARIVSQRP
jgi:hypothetical protein